MFDKLKDLGGLMQQAQAMQQKMQELQASLERMEIVGSSGAGLVRVTVNGKNETRTLYEYVHSPETPYADLVGQNVRSRYITEDVPGVVMPVARLARKAGIPSPRSDTIVDFASQLHGADYWTQGTTLESIGIIDDVVAKSPHNSVALTIPEGFVFDIIRRNPRTPRNFPR